jgi:hypothetical protein
MSRRTDQTGSGDASVRLTGLGWFGFQWQRSVGIGQKQGGPTKHLRFTTNFFRPLRIGQTKQMWRSQKNFFSILMFGVLQKSVLSSHGMGNVFGNNKLLGNQLVIGNFQHMLFFVHQSTKFLREKFGNEFKMLSKEFSSPFRQCVDVFF